MAYTSLSIVVRAGVSTDYGGAPASNGAVWVWLKDVAHPQPWHDRYFEVKPPWGNQVLATALGAITAGKRVQAHVGDPNVPSERNANGEPYCFRLYVTIE